MPCICCEMCCLPILLLAASLVLLQSSKTVEAFVFRLRGSDGTSLRTAPQQEEQEVSSSCPFSKAFPRYRIDLTTPAREKTSQNELFSKLRGFLPASIAKPKVPPGARLKWKPNEDGVTVLATLWRTAADLLSSDTTRSSNGVVVVAFPDAQPRVVQQWTDIYTWWSEQSDGSYQNALDNNFSRQIQLQFKDDQGVPSVQMMHQESDVDVKSGLSSSSSPWNHEVITKHTQAWVHRILVEQGICPFTKSVRSSGQGLTDLGVPVGRIAYHTSSARQICELMADCWEAIRDMLASGPSGPKGVSSILLAAPHWDDNFDDWAGPVFCMLEAGVIAAAAEEQVGVVCFHPQYLTSDGSTWPGFGHMHSVPRLRQWLHEQDPACPLTNSEIAAGGAWQRRTPHATLNVLRADQLASAESRRDSAKMYYNNIQKLVGQIGSDKLQSDLDRERGME